MSKDINLKVNLGYLEIQYIHGVKKNQSFFFIKLLRNKKKGNLK